MKSPTPTIDKTPNWCQFKLGFVEGSDWDTVASYAMDALVGITVRIATKEAPAPYDARIIESQHILGMEPSLAWQIEAPAGILVHPVDDNADPDPAYEPIFVAYEDIVSIDVY